MDQPSASRYRGQRERPVRPPPRKRYKLEAIPPTADAAMLLASALDPESTDIPKHFKCSVCRKVPPAAVYQCSKGHPICNECRLDNGDAICTYGSCRAGMQMAEDNDYFESEEGEWIRCLVLEKMLDSHWFACPFRKNGCQVVLSRQDVRKHMRDCVFDNRSVQICKYFCDSDEEACNYETCVAKPMEAMEHLQKEHGNMHRFIIYRSLGKDGEFTLYLNPYRDDYHVESVTTDKNGGIFLVSFWVDATKKTVSIACLLMNKPPTGQPEATLELSLESKNVEVSNWKMTVPIVSVLNGPAVLEEKPVTLSTSFLQNYVDKEEHGCAEIVIRIMWTL